MSFLSPASNLDKVLNLVADTFGVRSVAAFRKPHGHTTVQRSRMVFFYLVRRLTTMSYPEIGAYLGFDHSTVISGVRRVEKAIVEEPEFRAVIEDLTPRAKAHLSPPPQKPERLLSIVPKIA